MRSVPSRAPARSRRPACYERCVAACPRLWFAARCSYWIDLNGPGTVLEKPRRITLNDIARACGVSRATVSLVLRRSPLVHARLRQRVEAEMQRQGYVYNRAAANLRQRVSTTVALVINDLSNPFFAEFATGVDEALGAKGYVTLLGSSNESPARQRQVLGSLIEHRPAGIILSPAEISDVADIELAIGRHMPLLVFNRELGEQPHRRFRIRLPWPGQSRRHARGDCLAVGQGPPPYRLLWRSRRFQFLLSAPPGLSGCVRRPVSRSIRT